MGGIRGGADGRGNGGESCRLVAVPWERGGAMTARTSGPALAISGANAGKTHPVSGCNGRTRTAAQPRCDVVGRRVSVTGEHLDGDRHTSADREVKTHTLYIVC